MSGENNHDLVTFGAKPFFLFWRVPGLGAALHGVKPILAQRLTPGSSPLLTYVVGH